MSVLIWPFLSHFVHLLKSILTHINTLHKILTVRTYGISVIAILKGVNSINYPTHYKIQSIINETKIIT